MKERLWGSMEDYKSRGTSFRLKRQIKQPRLFTENNQGYITAPMFIKNEKPSLSWIVWTQVQRRLNLDIPQHTL